MSVSIREWADIFATFALTLGLPSDPPTARAWHIVVGTEGTAEELKIAAIRLAREWRRDLQLFPTPSDLLARLPGRRTAAEAEEEAWALVLQECRRDVPHYRNEDDDTSSRWSTLPREVFDAAGGRAGLEAIRAMIASVGESHNYAGRTAQAKRLLLDGLRAYAAAQAGGRALPSYTQPQIVAHEPEDPPAFNGPDDPDDDPEVRAAFRGRLEALASSLRNTRPSPARYEDGDGDKIAPETSARLRALTASIGNGGRDAGRAEVAP